MNNLTTKLSTLTNNNVNVAATFTRTTATGIELVQVFARPLAFGFVPLVEDLSQPGQTRGSPPRWVNPIDQLCRDFHAY
jgi:hypothetical protein